MARDDLRKKSSLGSKIFGLMLINIIPIAGLGYLVFALVTGRATLDDLPEELSRSALGFGLSLLLLILVAAGLLPLVHALAKWFRIQLSRSAAARAEGGMGRKLIEWILWPFRFVAYTLFWILRFALYLISFALILAFLIFLVRMVQPEFLAEHLPLEDWLETGINWLRDRY